MRGQAERVWGFAEGSGEDRVLRYLVGKKRPVPKAELCEVFPDILRLDSVLSTLQDAIWLRKETVYQVNKAQLTGARKKRRAATEKQRRAKQPRKPRGKRGYTVRAKLLAVLGEQDSPIDSSTLRELSGVDPTGLIYWMQQDGQIARVWGKTTSRQGWHYYVPGTAAERWDPAQCSQEVGKPIVQGLNALPECSARGRDKGDERKQRVETVPCSQASKGDPPGKHNGGIEAKPVTGHKPSGTGSRTPKHTRKSSADNAGLRCGRCNRSKRDVKQRKVPRPAGWNSARKGPFEERQDLCDDCWGEVGGGLPEGVASSPSVSRNDLTGMSIVERYKAGLLVDPDKRTTKMLIGGVK